MVDWDITVGGTTLTQVFDVQYSAGKSRTLGEASIVCGNNSNNRSVESGDEMIIEKNGVEDYRGYVTGKPTKAGASQTEIEIKATDKRMELKHQSVNRVFYQEDTGAIIRKAVNEKLETYAVDNQEHGNYIHKGNNKSGWSTNIPKFSLGDIASVTLENVGSNFLFAGWPSGSGGQSVYNLTFDNAQSAIPGGGQLDTFFTRMAINNKGDVFSVEIDLRDGSGNNYIWTPEIPESGFERYELKAENATTGASLGSKTTTDGTLQYRFSIDGTLPDSRAAAIDFSSVIPYATTSRNTAIDPSGVQNTGNVITRRIESSVFAMIKEFATEDGHISYIDVDDVLHYEKAGQRQGLEIDYNTTPVVDAEFDRDYKNITNKVTVQGDDDIRVTVEQTASVDFYGVSSREEPIVDKSIQTEKEAKRRGQGYLADKAWDDAAFTFDIADSDYRSLSLGDDVPVTWPPEDIQGTYQVSNVENDRNGYVTVELTR
jgi:hypothetical protein